MSFSKTMEVPFVKFVDEHPSLEYISSKLNVMDRNAIAIAPWPGFQYVPACEFTIAHDNKCVLLKFFVAEDTVLARFTGPNDLVYQDSCVEFFIAFDGEPEYYNLEFNCLGTCYLGYGSGKENRETAPVAIVKKIKSSTKLYAEDSQIKWELTLMIPNQVFYHHDIISLAAKKCRANFYKCGDDLPVPHYLCWNNIESERPNFHLSDFFGNITFGES